MALAQNVLVTVSAEMCTTSRVAAASEVDIVELIHIHIINCDS